MAPSCVLVIFKARFIYCVNKDGGGEEKKKKKKPTEKTAVSLLLGK